MTVLSQNRGTVHSIFKICISRNMKCDKTVGFLKYSHIILLPSTTVNQVINQIPILEYSPLYSLHSRHGWWVTDDRPAVAHLRGCLHYTYSMQAIATAGPYA